jgi:chitinase
VAFTANANDPGQDTFEYSWDWGDGTSGIITTNPVVTHTFEFIGVYTVALSVTDSDGATGQVEQPIDVTSNASDAYGVFLPIILR